MNTNWIWRDLEKNKPLPSRVRNVTHMRWVDFLDFSRGNAPDISCMVESLYAGDIILLRGAFSPEWMRELKRKTVEWCAARPPKFYKMLDGSPDFHRVIDHELGLKYAFRQCKHSAYFYNWNDDPLQIFYDIYERWSPLKELMGLRPNEYRDNAPRNGVVDRVQIVRYPPGAGYLEPHCDPHLHQRLFISAYMSKRGVDYEGGGFYLVGANNEKVDLEEQIEVGDIAIGYATVMHGVAPCVGPTDWAKDDGRWFLSLYANATDYSTKRHTGAAARLQVPGTLPEGLQ